jgi:hypothetical protein
MHNGYPHAQTHAQTSRPETDSAQKELGFKFNFDGGRCSARCVT